MRIVVYEILATVTLLNMHMTKYGIIYDTWVSLRNPWNCRMYAQSETLASVGLTQARPNCLSAKCKSGMTFFICGPFYVTLFLFKPLLIDQVEKWLDKGSFGSGRKITFTLLNWDTQFTLSADNWNKNVKETPSFCKPCISAQMTTPLLL